MKQLNRKLLMIFLAALGLAAPAQAASAGGLDTARIRQTYLDGDFDLAIEMIETVRKGGGRFSHADSVFIFKHLGVMYTAKYETRELGKQNMMRLLETEPSAKIMDMYASDMIYMIFKNIQDEFAVSQAKLARAKGHLQGNQAAGPESAGQGDGKSAVGKTPKGSGVSGGKSRGYSWVGWTAGAVAAAGGVALYVHLAEEQKSVQKVNKIE